MTEYENATIARENLRTKSNVIKSGLQALIKSKGFEPPKLSEAKTVFVKEWNRVKEMKNWKRTVFFLIKLLTQTKTLILIINNRNK